jgi:hypothetical protein
MKAVAPGFCRPLLSATMVFWNAPNILDDGPHRWSPDRAQQGEGLVDVRPALVGQDAGERLA